MIIHTSADEQVIRHAAVTARVEFDRFAERGSRSHTRAFNVTLTGGSARLPNGGRSHRYVYGKPNVHAATWDQWGVFLGAIFDADPYAKMTYYADADDFHWQTDGRFEKGWPEDAHGDHKWEVGVPFMQTCKRCSAVKRWSIR
jgi:hypothetical protein